METLVALDVAPINAPHRDLDYLPLTNKDFQIKDLITTLLKITSKSFANIDIITWMAVML